MLFSIAADSSGSPIRLGDVTRSTFRSPMTGVLEPGVHRNSRTVFVKMSYLLSRALP